MTDKIKAAPIKTTNTEDPKQYRQATITQIES